MMGHEASDDLDSSDDEDHFPPSQVFINNDGAKNNMAAQGGNNGKVNAKAAKFDKLLKVRSRGATVVNILRFGMSLQSILIWKTNLSDQLMMFECL